MEYYIKFKKGGFYTVVDAESVNDALLKVNGEAIEVRPYADVIKQNDFEREINRVMTKLVNEKIQTT